MTLLREILWPCQTDIAERYGLPPTTEGLQRIQNAVQRKITEGDVEVRALSDECLTLIGMSPLQNVIQEISAEEFLNCIYDYAGDSSDQEVISYFKSLQAKTPWEKAAKAEGLAAAQRLEEERKPTGGMTFGMLRTWFAFERLGLAPEHMVRQEAPPVVRLKRPSPDEVREYVMRNQPVIIEDGIDADSFPPLLDFTDFDYLHERCGQRYVKVKGDSCWDRHGRQLFLNDPTIEIPVSEYLDLIEVAEQHETCISWYMGKVPLREELPELWEDIEASPMSPMKKYGSCFGENSKGSYTYFGCGGNTTCIHCDPSENLMVVVAGEKTLDIFPPWEGDCLHTTVKKFLNSMVPPFLDGSELPADVQELYPKYQHAKPQRVHLKAGDMFYLPIFWWHAVAGGMGRNMILNWWCQQHPEKEHRYQAGEGTYDTMDVLSRLHEGWAENSPSHVSAAEQKVAAEMATAVIQSQQASAASGKTLQASKVGTGCKGFAGKSPGSGWSGLQASRTKQRSDVAESKNGHSPSYSECINRTQQSKSNFVHGIASSNASTGSSSGFSCRTTSTVFRWKARSARSQ